MSTVLTKVMTIPRTGWHGLRARAPRPADLPRPTVPDLVLGLGSVSLILVCLGLLAVPAYHHLQLRAKAAAVVGNAATLQLAAETFASVNQGRYAEHVEDLVPYLPKASAPRNPYTAGPIAFRAEAGDLTYRSPTRGGDYVIQAFAMGPGGEPVLARTMSGKRPR
jgi:hypothetical protein